jgi:hypothetical protein
MNALYQIKCFIVDIITLYMTISYRNIINDAPSAINDITGFKQAIHNKSIFYLFIILLLVAFLILNGNIHWRCFSSFALYTKFQVQFMSFFKFIQGWNTPKIQISSHFK